VVQVLGFGALFLIVLGARWWLVFEYGSSVPFLDQWNGEAGSVYLPYLHGTLQWANFFAPHNEHRIALTKAYGLILLIVDGQWNPQVQMVVNAAIIGGAVTALAAALWRLAGRRHLDVIGLLTALCFATPGAWENTLAGFQSQFYFLDLAAFVGLWALPFARPASVRWLAGACLLCLGLFSVATGFVAPIAAAIVTLLHHHGTQGLRRDAWITIGTALAIAMCGMALLPPTPADLAATRAHSIVGAASLLSRSLAWPFVAREWMFPIMWAPIAGLAVRACRRRRCEPVEAYLFGLAAWIGAHAVAIGWARGAASEVPPSRYADILAVGPVVNGTALALLLAAVSRTSLAGTVTFAAWLGVVAFGVDTLGRTALREAAGRRAWTTAYEANIRQLSRDHDLARFSRLTFPDQIPWINGRDLALDWLYDPALRAVMPPSLRDPLSLAAEGDTPFSSPGVYPSTPPLIDGSGLGSYAARGDATQGAFRSQPLECAAGGYLRFPIAGYPGAPGTSLAVQRADGAMFPITVRQPPRERWEPAFVRCPSGPFRVMASDTSPSTWLAFGPPVEIGWLGRLSERAAAGGRAVLLLGLLLALAAARLNWLTGRGERPRPTSTTPAAATP
jgi:hypothetical protein